MPIRDCYIDIPTVSTGWSVSGAPTTFRLEMKVLPDISDSKSANYSDEPLMGRSFPLKTYSHSDNRAIGMTVHMIVSEPSDIEYNLKALRAVQSAVYPRHSMGDAPYIPPPICRIKCGRLLAESDALCVILKQYNVKFPTEVAWDEASFVPFKFDIELSWETVYKSSDLPGAERIFQLGR
jgi:hypothetical protein